MTLDATRRLVSDDSGGLVAQPRSSTKKKKEPIDGFGAGKGTNIVISALLGSCQQKKKVKVTSSFIFCFYWRVPMCSSSTNSNIFSRSLTSVRPGSEPQHFCFLLILTNTINNEEVFKQDHLPFNGNSHEGKNAAANRNDGHELRDFAINPAERPVVGDHADEVKYDVER